MFVVGGSPAGLFVSFVGYFSSFGSFRSVVGLGGCSPLSFRCSSYLVSFAWLSDVCLCLFCGSPTGCFVEVVAGVCSVAAVFFCFVLFTGGGR